MSWLRPLIAVAIVCVAVGPVTAGPIINPDPLGDTFAGSTGPDIISISADTAENPGFSTITVRFAGPITPPSAFAPNSVVGYIDIDVDRNAATGTNPSLTTLFGGPPPFNLGAEFSISLFAELFNPGFVDITDGTGAIPLATVPVTFFSDGFTVLVPNSLLGSSEPNFQFNYAGVFGDFLSPSDRVPNGANPLSSSFSTPEPATLAVFGFLGLATLGYTRRRKTA